MCDEKSPSFHAENCFFDSLYYPQRNALDFAIQIGKEIQSGTDVDSNVAELCKFIDALCDHTQTKISAIFAQKAARDWSRHAPSFF